MALERKRMCTVHAVSRWIGRGHSCMYLYALQDTTYTYSGPRGRILMIRFAASLTRPLCCEVLHPPLVGLGNIRHRRC